MYEHQNLDIDYNTQMNFVQTNGTYVTLTTAELQIAEEKPEQENKKEKRVVKRITLYDWSWCSTNHLFHVHSKYYTTWPPQFEQRFS